MYIKNFIKGEIYTCIANKNNYMGNTVLTAKKFIKHFKEFELFSATTRLFAVVKNRFVFLEWCSSLILYLS